MVRRREKAGTRSAATPGWRALAGGIALALLSACGDLPDLTELPTTPADGPLLTVSPSEKYVIFENTEPGAESAPQLLSFTNAGTEALSLEVTVELADPAFVFTDTQPGAFELAPGDEVAFRLVFTPDSEGLHRGALGVAHSASNLGSPFTVTLEAESGSAPTSTQVPPITPTPETPTPGDLTPLPSATPTLPIPGQDGDSDGFGAAQDCDDADALVFPGAAEGCDGLDNDCDGRTDEAEDADGDGVAACAGDCDDADPQVHPGQPETWGDGEDQDCDGLDSGDLWVGGTDDVPQPGVPVKSTISAALDAAAEGAVILVLPGTYTEALDFGARSVTVIGVSGPELTFLRAPEAKPAARFGQGGAARLSGFTLQAGGASALVVQQSSPTLDHLTVEGGDATSGGGIGLWGFKGLLEDVTVAGGQAKQGGCLYISGGEPVLRQVSLTGCEADVGGALFVTAARLDARTLTITESRAGQGGGAYVQAAHGTLSQLVITGCEAEEIGAGMAVEGSGPAVDHALLAGNGPRSGAYELEGGGLWVGATGFEASQVLVLANRAQRGGGVAVASGSLSLSHATVSGNEADLGGGVWGCGDGSAITETILSFNVGRLGANAFWGEPEGGRSGTDSPEPVMSWLLVWLGEEEDAGIVGTEPTSTIVADPAYVVHGSEGWRGDDYRLQAASPARDAGSAGSPGDPDGGILDLGAWGGPGAASWDLDGDGFAPWWDPALGYQAGEDDWDDLDAACTPQSRCPGEDDPR